MPLQPEGERAGYKNNRNGALKAFAVPFERAFKASEDLRHLNVVVIVSCVNELSLLSGFLGRFFLAACFFCGLLYRFLLLLKFFAFLGHWAAPSDGVGAS